MKIKAKAKSVDVFQDDPLYSYVPNGMLRTLCKPIELIEERKGNPRVNEAAAKSLVEAIKVHGFRISCI